MKRKPAVLITLFIILGGTGAVLLFPAPSTSVPASMTFLYYTNRQQSVEELLSIGGDPEAVFGLTNRTPSPLRCDFSIEASNAASGLVSFSDGSSDVPANSGYLVHVVTPERTSNWYFMTVVSAPVPRAGWERHLALLLNKLGAHPRWLTRTRTYHATNVWIAQ